MAGINPIKIAESLSCLTKRGMTAMKEPKPSAKPKKPPSNIPMMKLNLRWRRAYCSIREGGCTLSFYHLDKSAFSSKIKTNVRSFQEGRIMTEELLTKGERTRLAIEDVATAR